MRKRCCSRPADESVAAGRAPHREMVDKLCRHTFLVGRTIHKINGKIYSRKAILKRYVPGAGSGPGEEGCWGSMQESRLHSTEHTQD